jgi:hypothetical protein
LPAPVINPVRPGAVEANDAATKANQLAEPQDRSGQVVPAE